MMTNNCHDDKQFIIYKYTVNKQTDRQTYIQKNLLIVLIL